MTRNRLAGLRFAAASVALASAAFLPMIAPAQTQGMPNERATADSGTAPSTGSAESSPAARGGTLPATIPVKRDPSESDSAGTPLSWTLAAALMLGLAAWAMVVGRRRAGASSEGVLEQWMRRSFRPSVGAAPAVQRLKTTQLSARHSLHVVQWHDQQLLIGCTDQTMVLLAQRGAEPSNPDSRAAQSTPPSPKGNA